MLRLIEPSDGSVYFDGEDIMEYGKRELKDFRRKAQLVYQDPTASLNPRHTVEHLVRQPMKIHDIGTSKDDRKTRTRELIHRVGLEDEHLDAHPHHLSGGQKQRVGIARALALEPDLLIADEPTSTLDASVQARILNLLDSLQREEELTMMFISHDLSVVRHISDRVAVMYLGQIVENAPTEQVFENPKHPYTQSLFSSIVSPDPNKSRDRIQLQGDVPSPINPPSGCRFHTRCPKQIPPVDWTGSQEVWVEFYNVKKSIQNHIENEEDSSDRHIDPEQILGSFDAGNQTDISNRAADTLDQVRELLVEDDLEGAHEALESEFVSPCETEIPEQIQEEDDHEVRCLIYGDQVDTDVVVEGQTS
jgi:peptide/nickel transport system ATP-binding protein